MREDRLLGRSAAFRLYRHLGLMLALLTMGVALAACSQNGSGQPAPGQSGTGAEAVAVKHQPGTGTQEGEVTLVIGAYSVVKDAFAELLPKFQAYWKEETGQNVVFQESYEASGTQARAIAAGFEADIAVLAMAGDIEKIAKAGLISHPWEKNLHDGMITRSIVVLGTREGNPKQIRSWEDLTRDDVKVLYPNPKTSGGAQWDINAIFGAGLKKSEEETGRKDPAYAKAFLQRVHDRVESLDKSGRASMAAFEYGVGDVIVTYENELLARIKQGVSYDIVIPESTILIENPAAVVDTNVDKHGTRKVAEAFLAYLHSPEAQRVLVEYGFRPVLEEIAQEIEGKYVNPPGMFEIEYLGGWDAVREQLYSAKGIWYQVLAGI